MTTTGCPNCTDDQRCYLCLASLDTDLYAHDWNDGSVEGDER